AAVRRFEAEDRLDRLGPRARYVARGGAVGVRSEILGPSLVRVLFDFPYNGLCAAEGVDAPGQCEQIAPVAIGVKQAPQEDVVVLAERLLELRQPVVGNRGEGFGSGEHTVLILAT